jgi:PIN domain nuclease of toxin-antitoxin system
MKNLLDTHTFIWFLEDNKNLLTTAIKYIEDEITKITSVL